TNFIHGFPQYCVSIALAHRGVITQAVVYDPARNDLFTATKGAGAFLNEKRIRVNKRDRLANALIAMGMPVGDTRAIEQSFQMGRAMADKCRGLRMQGAAALDLANVACGRLDGFYEKGLKPWDIAAGALLITEAGGIVTNFAGEADYLYKGDVITASPKVFAQMLPVLAPFA
ncbi:MAG TPA: inositol monophosphatase family protein, partial [Burkholderiaceae bacterium]